MSKRVAVIVGATGAASKGLVEALVAAPDWEVIGLCRRPPPTPQGRIRHIACDLLDPASADAALAGCRHATHIFYTARAPFSDATAGKEDVAGNVGMLANLLDAAERHAGGLEHVHLVEGTKWYGLHLGPMRTPAREDAARHMPPNFYYDQQDLLAACQRGKRWSWSASRPGFLYDFAPERPRNLVALIGAWAAMCREHGMALDFPGTPACYDALWEATDAGQLARGMIWMATAPAARNEAFNLTDGSLFRWSVLWPRLAAHLGMPLGRVTPMALGQAMADKEPAWQRIVTRHGLAAQPMASVVNWGFGDFLWSREGDVVSSMTKARLAGFHDTIDTEARIIELLDRYRRERILP